MAKLLVVDNSNRKVWKRLSARLEFQGHSVERVTNESLALKLLLRDEFEVVVSDDRIAAQNNYEFVREVKRTEPDTSIIVTSEIGSFHRLSDALSANGGGYVDFVTNLWPPDRMERLIEHAVDLQRERSRTRAVRDAAEDRLFVESRSPVMRRLLESAQQAATSESTILLTGASGTGKTLLARQMHFWSSRQAKPFGIVNCATLSSQNLEREILGRTATVHLEAKRSGSLLERATGGAVLLADISDLSLSVQLALVRFVQDRTLETAEGHKTIDLRIFAATSRDLLSEVAAHRFREDLFYGLNIISLCVPALCERSADILPLARRMLAAAAVRNHRRRLSISNEAARAMTFYRWPGNVRELRNAIEAATVLSEMDTITLAHLPEAVATRLRNVARPIRTRPSLDEIEREHIARVLENSRTLEDAAMKLGINASTLWRKRKRYKLESLATSKA
jgi:two-component system, NtrC family, response regulator AlgB